MTSRRTSIALLAANLFSVALVAPSTVLAQDSGAVPKGGDGAIKKPEVPAPEPGKPTPPRLVKYAPPDYPPEEKDKGAEAEVILQLEIDAAGKVTRAAVVQGASTAFDEAAIAAAKKLEWEPARNADGVAAPSRIGFRYTFKLDPVDTPQPNGEVPTDKPSSATEERATLRGVVLISGSEVPLAGAEIFLGQDRSTTTDANGRFEFSDIAPGDFAVRVSASGYEALTVGEQLTKGAALEIKYRLTPLGNGLEVTVRGERPPREVVKRTITAREIARIPGTNGDALRSLQNLPGVARPPAIAGILLVRGSGPADTQTFIDGTGVPLIYHFGGLSSVVPTEVLDRIDFYPGNFSAQYGRVQGGIVDVALRSPKDDGYHGLVSVDLIDARGLFEGPVPLLDGWTFLLGFRRSYIDAWLGPTLEAAGAGVTQAPVYYDYQAILEHNGDSSGRFRTAFFGSDDRLELLVEQAPGDPGLAGNIGLATSFQRLQFLYENDFGELQFRGTVALGQDDIEFGLGPFFFLLNSKTILSRLELSHRISKGVTLNFGTDVIGGSAEVNVRLPAPGRPGEPPNQPFSTRKTFTLSSSQGYLFPAIYAEAELVPHPNVRIVPGVRLDYSSFNDEFDVNPRVNARFDVVREFPRSTIKTGFGMFSQPPQFQQVIEPLGNPEVSSNRSIHYALGYEQEITRNLEVSTEGFVKQLDNLVVGTADPSGLGTTWSNEGRGYVIGNEVLLKYKPDERFFGWLAYTLSRSVRQNGEGEPERLVNFDQTHILTILGSYKLGHGWEIGGRFRLVSGNLTTPNVCNPSDANCDTRRTNGLFFAPSGTYVPIPVGEQNSERLPFFHQLDVRIDKKWQFSDWALSTYLDVQNVYNNQNTEAIGYNFDFTERSYVSGLPILPSIGVRADF